MRALFAVRVTILAQYEEKAKDKVKRFLATSATMKKRPRSKCNEFDYEELVALWEPLAKKEKTGLQMEW